MKKIILGIIIGIVLCSGIVYGVNIYSANDIEYTTDDGTKTNVNEALNDLYTTKTELANIKSIGDATAADIASGKTAVVQGVEVTGTAITSIDSALTTQSRSVSETYSKDASYYKTFSKSVTFSFPNKVIGVVGASTSYGHSAIKNISISGNKVSFSLYYGYVSSSETGTNSVTIKAIGY